MGPSNDRAVRGLSRLCFVLASLCVVGAAAATAAGLEDGMLFAPFFGLPLLVLGFGLRSNRRRRRTATGVAGLLWAVLNVLVVIGNWPGYDPRGRILVPVCMAPIVGMGLAVFLVTTAPARLRQDRPSPPGRDRWSHPGSTPAT